MSKSHKVTTVESINAELRMAQWEGVSIGSVTTLCISRTTVELRTEEAYEINVEECIEVSFQEVR
jgi:hypothetical protein